MADGKTWEMAGMKLPRCPRFYLEKERPDLNPWVNEMLRIYSSIESGSLMAMCPSPSNKTIEAIDIIGQETARVRAEKVKEMQRK